jgi:hypothetical protein
MKPPGPNPKAVSGQKLHHALGHDPSARDVMAVSCQHCGADVSAIPQGPREAYDHVEIPEIKPEV